MRRACSRALERSDSLSDERSQKQLYHACALYEAGKRHREHGDWGGKEAVCSCEETGALPEELQQKTLTYIEDCKRRAKNFGKSKT